MCFASVPALAAWQSDTTPTSQNNTTADGQAISLGQEYTKELTNARDVYTFEASAGEHIRIPTIGGAHVLQATLYVPDGSVVDTHDLYVEEIPMGGEAPQTETYTLVFESPAAGANGQQYSFSVTTASDERSEANRTERLPGDRGPTRRNVAGHSQRGG